MIENLGKEKDNIVQIGHLDQPTVTDVVVIDKKSETEEEKNSSPDLPFENLRTGINSDLSMPQPCYNAKSSLLHVTIVTMLQSCYNTI